MKSGTRVLAIIFTLIFFAATTACKPDRAETSGTPSFDSDTSVPKTEDSRADNSGVSEDEAPDNSAGKEESKKATGNPAPGPGPLSKDKVKEEALKKLDFGGKTVTIMYSWQPTLQRGVSPGTDLWLDRRDVLEKKYKVKIVQKKGSADYYGEITTSIMSGSPTAHIYMNNGQKEYSFISSGLAANLNQALKVSGVDFEDDLYDQTLRKYYTVNDNVYFFGFNQVEPISVVLFNKRILNGLKIDPYQLIESGQWTWDKFGEIARQATVRGSGGTITQYGLGISMSYSGVFSMVLANNGKIGTLDKQGRPRMNLKSKEVNEALERLYQWCVTDKTVLFNTGSSDWRTMAEEFAKGKIALYMGGTVAIDVAYEKGMKDEWGLAYIPKGPGGKGYVSPMGSGYSFFIPKTYENDAARYLLLIDQMMQKYPNRTSEQSLKDSWIAKFTDAKAYNIFKKIMLDKSIRVSEPADRFGVIWGSQPFGSITGKLMTGEITPSVLVEKYNDSYQTLLNDEFGNMRITG